MVDTVIPGVGYTFFPDWHLEPYLGNMRRLLSLDWDTFVPGHFWCTDREGFRQNLKYYEEVRTVAEEALVSGVDPMELDTVRSFAEEKLNAYEDFFRYNEYVGQNLMRYMLQLKTGGWGVEGVTSSRTGELSPDSEVTLAQ
jgi:glyoxylase-like metal-dependent hydrolase (beta-lactamase superfamily II)